MKYFPIGTSHSPPPEGLIANLEKLGFSRQDIIIHGAFVKIKLPENQYLKLVHNQHRYDLAEYSIFYGDFKLATASVKQAVYDCRAHVSLDRDAVEAALKANPKSFTFAEYNYTESQAQYNSKKTLQSLRTSGEAGKANMACAAADPATLELYRAMTAKKALERQLELERQIERQPYGPYQTGYRFPKI